MNKSSKENNKQHQRCGFVAVIGLPNAGKSTLVNALVGTKVSIVSRKVQTTRARITGILTSDQTQIILLDTPGIFTPKKTLEKAMVRAALDTLSEVDVIVHLVDVSAKNPFENNHNIIEKLPSSVPCVLALNKVDKTSKAALLKTAEEFNHSKSYAATFMVSALKTDGLGALTDFLENAMPEGPWHYDEDQVLDMPMRLLAAEITREKIFERLHQELPYAIMVETENWETFDNGSVKIDQVIYVQKDSQKGIVLGRKGQQIKTIGQAAREELEEILETRIHLKLYVKVQEKWAEQLENFRIIGLEI